MFVIYWGSNHLSVIQKWSSQISVNHWYPLLGTVLKLFPQGDGVDQYDRGKMRRTVDRSQPQAAKGAEIQNPFGGIFGKLMRYIINSVIK